MIYSSDYIHIKAHISMFPANYVNVSSHTSMFPANYVNVSSHTSMFPANYVNVSSHTSMFPANYINMSFHTNKFTETNKRYNQSSCKGLATGGTFQRTGGSTRAISGHPVVSDNNLLYYFINHFVKP